jgi:excisionase family DNA binding protein
LGVVVHAREETPHDLVRISPRSLLGLDPVAVETLGENSQMPTGIVDLIGLLVAACHKVLVESDRARWLTVNEWRDPRCDCMERRDEREHSPVSNERARVQCRLDRRFDGVTPRGALRLHDPHDAQRVRQSGLSTGPEKQDPDDRFPILAGTSPSSGIERRVRGSGGQRDGLCGLGPASQAFVAPRKQSEGGSAVLGAIRTVSDPVFGTGSASPTFDDDPLLTVREVADRLRVCAATVYRLIEKGSLPCVRVGGSMLRIRSSALAPSPSDSTKT